jgi:hypothetical protein
MTDVENRRKARRKTRSYKQNKVCALLNSSVFHCLHFSPKITKKTGVVFVA